ncbi:unnamed protein product [Effrenium voratum]|nr:unnamed protein product [Effrenium voratum]
MLGWSSVQLGAKAADDLCEAKLTVVLRPGSPHNSIDEVNSEVIFVSVGENAKRGRANSELVGFVQNLLGLQDGQVRLEDTASNKSKTVILSNLALDKRSLIWQLQSKVGQRHEARFASEQANAALRMADVAAKRRKEEQSEYRRLQEQADADAVSAAAALPSPYAEKVALRPTLPRGIRIRRPGEPESDVAPAEEPAEPEEAEPEPVPDAAHGETLGEATSGLQGLAHYSSSESEESEES